MITIEDIRNPTLKSGFRGVRFENVPGRPKPYAAQPAGQGRKGDPPHRATAVEAAQDYCDYVNGQSTVATYEGRNGRPDFYKQGRLHRDLPSLTRGLRLPPLPSSRRHRERDLIERMTPVMDVLMQDGDLAEAKATTQRGDLATAIGQLLLGRLEKGDPDARLYIVLPEEPPAPRSTYLLALGIHPVWPA